MSRSLPLALGILTLAACGENVTPTQPEIGADPAPAALSFAAAPNTWTVKSTPPFTTDIYGYDLGMAPNAAGQSIVYTFGGTSSDEGGTGLAVRAYNVATNTWAGRTSRVFVYNSNGVGKIGNKLYFSGGYLNSEASPDASRQLWAYDYSNDRLIQKANLPIFSAEGVSGVINGKLYVLPGACDGNGYPNSGYCAVEETRRFYRYDPATNAWVTRPQAPHFHRDGAAGVINGKFYVTGGSSTALDVYDPATNSWRTRASIPLGGPASGAVIGGRFYVVVEHFNGSTPDHRLYSYNPATNEWKARAKPGFFGSATRVELDGRFHLFMATGNKSALYTP
jgi:N-acetylneuraminic acid mutarotase